MTEDEMVGWHHGLNGHGFRETPGIGDGQGGLACCGSWGRKESDTTERLYLSRYCLSSISCQIRSGIIFSQEHEPFCELHMRRI